MSSAVLSAVLVLVAAALGLLAPRVTAALPPADLGVLPDGEAPPPSYREIAARPGLRWQVVGCAAILALAVVLSVDAGWAWAYLLPIAPVLALLAIIDWHTRLLPSPLVLPATGLVLLVAAAESVADDWHRPLAAVVTGLVVRSFFWLLWRIRSAGMGFGDVRLAALLGLALGRLGVGETLTGVYAGFLLFALPGLVLALVHRDRSILRRAYPFGPFLVAGALVGILAGPVLLPTL